MDKNYSVVLFRIGDFYTGSRTKEWKVAYDFTAYHYDIVLYNETLPVFLNPPEGEILDMFIGAFERKYQIWKKLNHQFI